MPPRSFVRETSRRVFRHSGAMQKFPHKSNIQIDQSCSQDWIKKLKGPIDIDCSFSRGPQNRPFSGDMKHKCFAFTTLCMRTIQVDEWSGIFQKKVVFNWELTCVRKQCCQRQDPYCAGCDRPHGDSTTEKRTVLLRYRCCN